ncbi:MAG: SLC13 family permease [Ilumatobacteraceae bacterium]
MTADAWLVLVVLVGIVVVLATNRVSTVVGMGAGLGLLLVAGAIDEDVALSGLSSPATATIAALYVVAAAISATGAMSLVIDRVMFGPSRRLLRLSTSTAVMSAFVPNTPLVAIAAPRVVRWSRNHGISSSTLLMPLSFASILGGVVTVLGTSTNLVVSDVLAERGGEPLGIFEITPVGLPVAVVGVTLMVVLAPRLLRARTPAGESMRGAAQQYQIQMLVEDAGPVADTTVREAGLRDLDGVYLAAIERDDRLVAAGPDTVLAGRDRLYFVGDIVRVIDLQEVAGLVSAEQPHLLDATGAGVRLYEAVVSGRSDLAGRTLKAAAFRSRYGAAVLAVHRSDGDLRGKLGSIELEVGDVLLVLAGPEFADRGRDHGDFALIASVDEAPPVRRRQAPVAALALAGLLLLATLGVVSLLVASLLASVAVLVGGALSLTEARHAIDLNVVLTIALSISLGGAVSSTGLADQIAEHLVRLGDPLGVTGLLAMVIVCTQLLTEVLSNSGAAALMVPVAMSAAVAAGGDPRAFAVGVLVGASCSFLTPIGYQTNLMVYGLGGYRFTDFTRVGLPLTISSAVVATLALGPLGLLH